MTQRIIYQQDDGTVAVIAPSDEALAHYTIQEIAVKDVPPGKPFKIVPLSDIPVDRYFRNAWEVDAAILTDGTGNASGQFEK